MTGEPAVTLADAAAAARAAAGGGPAVAIVVGLVPDTIAGRRLLRDADGRTRGTLGTAALDDAVQPLASAVLAGAAAAAHELEAGGACYRVFVEAHRAPERLIVVGAGHIAVPLANFGAQCGFRVTVLDDRDEFASAARFADDVAVRRVDFDSDPFAGVEIDEHSYVALVTRGHRWDFDCLTRLLEAPVQPQYIGMIGSRRRVRAAFGALLDAGIARAELAAIHAPIGVDIGAETPEEIAVSILAELIHVRRGGRAASLAQRERVLERLLPEEERDARQ